MTHRIVSLSKRPFTFMGFPYPNLLIRSKICKPFLFAGAGGTAEEEKWAVGCFLFTIEEDGKRRGKAEKQPCLLASSFIPYLTEK
jgi:hypothetical protein